MRMFDFYLDLENVRGLAMKWGQSLWTALVWLGSAESERIHPGLVRHET